MKNIDDKQEYYAVVYNRSINNWDVTMHIAFKPRISNSVNGKEMKEFLVRIQEDMRVIDLRKKYFRNRRDIVNACHAGYSLGVFASKDKSLVRYWTLKELLLDKNA